jgi:hypothetical protein
MKKIIPLFLALLALSTSPDANARDGSWFAGSLGYENLASGITESGLAIGAEGGYWYLGNVAYGGYFKGNFFGEAGGVSGSNLKIFDLGGFLKAGNDAGLYGKLLMGVAFVNLTGNVASFNVGDGKSFYFGLGGGFLFPVSDGVEAGPEVLYRHLTAGHGGDEISLSGLVSFNF